MPLQVLHDAFFKNQTKPPLSQMGQLYYEGKEYEAHVSVADTALCPSCNISLLHLRA